MKKNRQFDIVIYGATGYTGQLVAEYFAKQYGQDKSSSFALAGRSKEKLASVAKSLQLGADTCLIEADASQPASMEDMVRQAKLIITTVGPYQLYGSVLVEMCAKHGTDYVDLCGESVWMRHMIDAHEEQAKASGARIVFSCGFDSIPSDLGVYRLQELARQQTGAVCKEVHCRVRAMQGTFSGGTAASFKASMAAAKSDPENYKLAINPYALVPDFKGVDQPPGDKVYFHDAIDSWVAPFVMALINTRNVHRSNALLGHAYGSDFIYDEMVMTGKGEAGEQRAQFVASNSDIGAKGGPKPGEGPSKEEREAGFFDMLFVGVAKDGTQLKVSVKGDRDPGYGSTSKMLSEAAVCLLRDATETPGGIWTTAPAMGDKLISRLEANAGLTFTQE